MSMEGVLIALVLVAGTALWIASPLLHARRPASADTQAQKRRERLAVYYERVITNLRDLDEDFATGKIAEGDYQTEREVWMQRGIQALKALDGVETEIIAVAAETDDHIDQQIDEAIETAIAAYRHS